jgi:predicted metal-dependent peptidase
MLVPHAQPGLNTFAVTKHGVMLYDPAVVERWSVEEIAAVIAHEVNHPLRDHEARGERINAEHNLWNVAADLEINDDLKRAAMKLPDGGLFPERFGFDDGLTAEEYYRALRQKEEDEKQQQKQEQSGDDSGDQNPSEGEGDDDAGDQDSDDTDDGDAGDQDSGDDQSDEDGDQNGGGGSDDGSDDGDQSAGGGDQAGDDADDGEGDGDGDGDGQGDGGHKIGNGQCGGCAGNPKPHEAAIDEKYGRSDRDIAQTRRTVAEAVKKYAESGRGTVPGGLVRWSESLLKPPAIPWRQKLARAVRCAAAFRAGAVDTAYDRPSRRQSGIGYGRGRPVLPAYRAPIPKIAVIVDTSGSMGSDELAEAVSETAGMLKAVGGNITFVACDADTEGVKSVSRWQQLKDLMVGGGGTDMTPAFEAIAEHRERTDVIVCVTDGELYGGHPDEPPPRTKVIWVVVGDYRGELPWGEVIYTDEVRS